MLLEMTMKHELVIEEYYDNDGEIMYASKGHHKKKPFMAAVQEYYYENIRGDVERIYMRATPANDTDRIRYRVYKCKRGHGAFPVTRIKRLFQEVYCNSI
jgi:hypothetical protein